MCSPTYKTCIPTYMCFPTRETHFPSDIRSSTLETYISSDMMYVCRLTAAVGSLLLKNLIVFLWASSQHVFLFSVAKQKSWIWIWSIWKTWKIFDQGCSPFAWKNQKFRWENQMVCAILFWKLQKMWAVIGGNETFLLFSVCSAYLDILCGSLFSHQFEFYSFMFMQKISTQVVCVNVKAPRFPTVN